MPSNSQIAIHFADTPKDLHDAFNLRYRVFRNELQRSNAYVDSQRGIYTDIVDENGGQVIVAKTVSGEIVGTLRLTLRRTSAFLPEDEEGFTELISSHDKNSLALADRGAICKEHRGKGLYPLLWAALENRCRQESVTLLLGVIDAENKLLNNFHSSRGWTIHRENCYEHDGRWNYISKLMTG